MGHLNRILVCSMCALALTTLELGLPWSSRAGDGRLRIATDSTEYGPGARVELSFTNEGGVALLVDPCPTALQRRAGDDWLPAIGVGSSGCTADRARVAPGDTLHAYIDLPPKLGDGTYRARFDRTRLDDAKTPVPLADRVTNAFDVRCRHFRCRRLR